MWGRCDIHLLFLKVSYLLRLKLDLPKNKKFLGIVKADTYGHQYLFCRDSCIKEGIDVVCDAIGEREATIWCAAIDPGMNENKYIVPGFGDCGDLCFGEKL